MLGPSVLEPRDRVPPMLQAVDTPVVGGAADQKLEKLVC